jgi:hypothetical protein
MNKLTPEQRQQIKLYKSIQRRLGSCYTDAMFFDTQLAAGLLVSIHHIDAQITEIERGQQ